MDLLTLAVLCGPMVDPAMTLRVISVESAGHAFAVHDNTSGNAYEPETAAAAVNVANSLIRAGHRIDLGLMQINYDAWLRPVGVSLAQALDPCTNIRFGTTLLSANYTHALAQSRSPSDALKRALSEYNSGSESRSYSYAVKILSGRTDLKLLRLQVPRNQNSNAPASGFLNDPPR